MLTIDRLHLECRTARDHPSPSDVSARLRQLVQRRLPGELATRFDAGTSPIDSRVVLIRRLHVHLSLDASRDEAVLAKVFAAAIVAGIESADHDGDDVITYANDVEQVTRLLVDLASGVAWDRWHHRRAFPGLVHLPPTTAIRTIAVESPPRFLDAAARMTMRSLRSMSAALDPADARRIVDSLPVDDGGGVDAATATAVCELWLEEPAARADELLLVLAAHREVMGAPISPLRAVVRAIDAVISARGLEREVPAVLADVDVALVERLYEEAIPNVGRPSVATPVGDEVTWTTPYGALFLLLPYMVKAGDVAASAARRAGLVRALVGASAIRDPAIAALLGLDEPAADGAELESIETATLDWLERVRAIGPVRPVVHTSRCAGQRVALVVDQPTGHWLAVTSGRGTAAALRRISDRYGTVERGRPVRVAAELRRLGAFAGADLDDCMTATNLIRRVANSLPGFASTSSAHVWREALDVAAQVTVTEAGWRVRVDRSPLAEILRICGHGDRATTVPWLDDLTVRVVIAP